MICSIIIPHHNLVSLLKRCLDSIPDIDDFEVIVVDESSTDDTEDVLKRLKKDFPCLYTTFIPSSSHYLSRHKLALTIGMKAAHNEWVIITDADCKPNGSNWLTTMASYCNDSHDIVLGYTNYEPSSKQFQRFERLQAFCYIIHSFFYRSRTATFC